MLYELPKEYQDEVYFGLLDFEKNKSFALKLKVRGFPTLFFYKEGSLFTTHGGPLTKTTLDNLLNNYLDDD